MRTTARVLAIAALLAVAGALPARQTRDCLLVRYLTGREGPSRLRLVELSTGKALRQYTLPVNKGFWLAPSLGSLLYATEKGEVQSLDLRTGKSKPFGTVPPRLTLPSLSPSGTKAIYANNEELWTHSVLDLRTGESFRLGEGIQTASWAPGKDVVLCTKPQEAPVSALDSIAEGPDWQPRKADPTAAEGPDGMVVVAVEAATP